jgi:hypothetical protein
VNLSRVITPEHALVNRKSNSTNNGANVREIKILFKRLSQVELSREEKEKWDARDCFVVELWRACFGLGGNGGEHAARSLAPHVLSTTPH